MASIRYVKGRRKPWILQYRDATGKKRSPGFKTEREAKEHKPAAERQERQRRTGLGDPHLTVGEYAERWISYASYALRPPTYQSYRRALKNHVVPAIGGVRLQTLDRVQLKAWLGGMLRAGKGAATVQAVAGVVRRLLAEAVEERLIENNPALGLGRPLHLKGYDPSRIRAMDAHQLRRFLECARTQAAALYAFFLVCSHAGLRLGEAMALQADDVDLDGAQIRIERQLYPDGSIAQPKSKQGKRSVDLAAPVVETLRAVLATRREQALSKAHDGPWLLFPELKEKPGDDAKKLRGRITYVMRRMLLAAGLPPGFSPHDLRHTFASLLLQQGESPVYVQRQMGHASIKTTVDLYGRWLPMSSKAAVDRLAARVSGK